MNKVLVIGMDGATFDLIDPWIKEGKLPILEECIRQGTRSALLSTPLSNSAQAWSSFITGKNPGKHGIYDFFETLPYSYGVRFLNASFRSGKSLWRMVSEAGKKVGIINVPITYPAEEVNGFLIPGLDSPGMNGNFAYPRGLMEEINEHIGEYVLEAGIWGYIRRGKPQIALEKLLEMVKTRTAAAKYLIQNKDWDLFMVVYTATDKVQHHFWKYIDPMRPEFSKDYSYSSAILQVYQQIDRSIGELISLAPDASVIIMSDHGAGASSRNTMFINRWLQKEGFFYFKDSAGISGRWSRLKYIFLEKINNKIKKFFPRKSKEILLRLFPKLRDKVDSVLFLPGIDWSRTVAYSRENHPAIFINTKGREAKGIVEPGKKYEGIRNQLIKKLQKLRDPDSGQLIIGKIVRSEDVYNGPKKFKAPDIIFQWNQHLYVHRPSGVGSNKPVLERLDDKALLSSENTIRPSGIHRDYGIFIAFGNYLKKSNDLDGAKIYDIAPTILYLLGIPIPDDVDGRVFEGAIEDDYLLKNQIKKSAIFTKEEGAPQDFDPGEISDIKKRLQGLGYID